MSPSRPVSMPRRTSKPRVVCTASLTAFATALSLWTATAAAGRDDPPTVGTVTDDNGLTSDGMFRIKTPSIVRIEMSEPVPADIGVALQHYDRIIELPAVEPSVRAEAMRRAAYLRVQRADTGDGSPEDLKRGIAIYEQLLKEVPDDPANDRALYQLARAYQLDGRAEDSIASLQQLGQRFPQSALVGDGVFRAAELLYARARYDEAEQAYSTVLAQGKDGRYYQPAEYKYGWSLYQQAKYGPSLDVFVRIIDAELPAGPVDRFDTALGSVKQNRRDVVQESLRAASLSVVGLGGGDALNQHFKQASEPRFSSALYRASGDYLLGKQRYTDAAGMYGAYRKQHAQSELAPQFQTLAIDAYRAGGFSDLVLSAKEEYARAYAPDSAYWSTRQPTAEQLATTRGHYDDIARHYQALAQRTPANEATRRQQYFLTAADWYQRTLKLFPADANTPQLHILYADALLDGGKTQQAAVEYQHAAYDYPQFAKAPEAAFASVQVYQRLAREAGGPQRDAALQQSVDSALQLAQRMPQHAQRNAVLTQSAEDLLTLGKNEQAVDVAGQVLADGAAPTPEQRLRSLAVTADARYSLKQYELAEVAYTNLLRVMPNGDAQRGDATERLAASVYKQGEAAREAGDLKLAATSFQRVGRVAPDSTLRASADYDAAVAYAELKDWPSTQAALESFRSRYPQHALSADVDKRLAYAYEQDSKWRQAADVYTRIARREVENPATRRDSAWLAASLYDRDHQPVMTAQAYEFYLSQYGKGGADLDRSMQARRRLADLSRDELHDRGVYQRWLQEIIAADAAAGSARNATTQRMAAQASLEIGRDEALQARAIALSLPVEKSMPQRLAATEKAIATLTRAARAGDAEITTAATYELGSVYREFGRAIMTSSRPSNLEGDALEQYNILLEEQAFPFEEKAIAAYEANLARLGQGHWNDWIHQSAKALTELSPAKYGKQDQRETVYDSLL